MGVCTGSGPSSRVRATSRSSEASEKSGLLTLRGCGGTGPEAGLAAAGADEAAGGADDAGGEAGSEGRRPPGAAPSPPSCEASWHPAAESRPIPATLSNSRRDMI
ncbi:hypothetical protein GCM10009663_14680 [Kitasatospora arboriphila]|uniref:Uncharacterized protein n=1 Tax=Kitasatospora arboriphila TaxID=258052 RepID=A0ABP4DVX8_9ACTN